MFETAYVSGARRFDLKEELNYLLDRHPYAGYFAAGIGLPVAVLGGVAAAAYAVMMPLSMLLGWL